MSHDPEQSLVMSTGLQPSWWRIPIVIVTVTAPGAGDTPVTEVHLFTTRPGDQAATAPAQQAPRRAARHAPPGRRLPARRYIARAGGAGLPQPPHAALCRGMQMGPTPMSSYTFHLDPPTIPREEGASFCKAKLPMFLDEISIFSQ